MNELYQWFVTNWNVILITVLIFDQFLNLLIMSLIFFRLGKLPMKG
jgi:hypothetical protein